jgi:hypothetical protein
MANDLQTLLNDDCQSSSEDLQTLLNDGGNVLVLEQKLVKMEQDCDRTIALLEQGLQMRQQAHRAHLTYLPLQTRPSQLDKASPEAVEAFARIKWRMPVTACASDSTSLGTSTRPNPNGHGKASPEAVEAFARIKWRMPVTASHSTSIGTSLRPNPNGHHVGAREGDQHNRNTHTRSILASLVFEYCLGLSSNPSITKEYIKLCK